MTHSPNPASRPGDGEDLRAAIDALEQAAGAKYWQDDQGYRDADIRAAQVARDVARKRVDDLIEAALAAGPLPTTAPSDRDVAALRELSEEASKGRTISDARQSQRRFWEACEAYVRTHVLQPAPAGSGDAEAVRTEAAFLIDRLKDFASDGLTEDGARDWHGHVQPSIARLSSALAAPPLPTREGAGLNRDAVARIIDQQAFREHHEAADTAFLAAMQSRREIALEDADAILALQTPAPGVAEAVAALREIANLTPEPDDKAWRDDWNEPAGYRFFDLIGQVHETSVDTSNHGDIESWAHEKGLHAAAVIARAALATIEAQGRGAGETVPEGWRLVPVEPTEAMTTAVNWDGPQVSSIRAAHGPNTVSTLQAKLVYRAMLAAAPLPAAPTTPPSPAPDASGGA